MRAATAPYFKASIRVIFSMFFMTNTPAAEFGRQARPSGDKQPNVKIHPCRWRIAKWASGVDACCQCKFDSLSLNTRRTVACVDPSETPVTEIVHDFPRNSWSGARFVETPVCPECLECREVSHHYWHGGNRHDPPVARRRINAKATAPTMTNMHAAGTRNLILP